MKHLYEKRSEKKGKTEFEINFKHKYAPLLTNILLQNSKNIKHDKDLTITGRKSRIKFNIVSNKDGQIKLSEENVEGLDAQTTQVEKINSHLNVIFSYFSCLDMDVIVEIPVIKKREWLNFLDKNESFSFKFWKSKNVNIRNMFYKTVFKSLILAGFFIPGMHFYSDPHF